jgi:RimJ/RimL family protein N-acetyltransferase
VNTETSSPEAADGPGSAPAWPAAAYARFAPELARDPQLLERVRAGLADEVAGFAAAPVAAPVELRGQRVHLRPLVPDDYAAWRLLVAANATRLGSVEPAVADAAGFELRCRSVELAALVGLSLNLGLFVAGGGPGAEGRGGRAGGAELAGGVDLGFDAAGAATPTQGTTFISCWIDPRSTTPAVVSEAAILALAHVFDERQGPRVEFAVLPEQAPMRRGLERARLRDEGRAPRYAAASATWADHVRYTMSASEWAADRDELLGFATEGRPLDG